MLSNHSSRVYCDEYDMQGLLKVLGECIQFTDDASKRDICFGAYITIEGLLGNTFRDQSEFMDVFNNKVTSYLLEGTN